MSIEAKITESKDQVSSLGSVPLEGKEHVSSLGPAPSESKDQPTSSTSISLEIKDPPCIGDEGVLSVVSKIMLDKRFNELAQENERLKKRLELLKTVITDKCGYADELVWYARSQPDNPVAQPAQRKVEVKWPQHVQKLTEDETNWQHGYNSACLALSRLLLDIVDADARVADLNAQDEDDEESPKMTTDDYIKQAIAEYPFLDT